MAEIRIALVQFGFVANVIVAPDVAYALPGFECVVLEEGQACAKGWAYVNGVFAEPETARSMRVTNRQFVRRFLLPELTATLALRNSSPMVEAMLLILNADDGPDAGVDLDDPDTIGFVNYLHFVEGTIPSEARVEEILDPMR